MSSSCLSSGGGGGRAYRLEAMDMEIIKSPSSTSWISSPSSESSNCAGAISTRKARTPRKRPNQTYNEAAALLSTAYPKIFPTTKFDNYANNTFFLEPSELLMPFHQVDTSRLLLHLHLHKPLPIPCRSPPDSSDFDADSILDEEIGGGIESIMGNLEMEKEESPSPTDNTSFCYGYPVGLGLRAMKSGDEWWKFPCVNVADVNPNVVTKKKKKVEEESEEQSEGLLLNLNYDGVLHAWSDKPSPFSAADPNDVRARLAQIDLFSDNGGVREASVQRYKEKRRTRLFSKKIRYQVRKLNADRRPRMKGRFVRTPTSSDD